MHAAEQPVAQGPADQRVVRRPGSVRRTTSIDMSWADGWGSPLTLHGTARDLRTGVDGVAAEVAASSMRLVVAPDRTVAELVTTPSWPALAGLVGARTGGGFRARLADLRRPSDLRGSDPLHLLLDDVPGATLISGFAFSQWLPIDDLLAGATGAGAVRPMTGICTGFRPGSSGLAPDGTSRWTHRTQLVAPLHEAPDPLAWHDLAEIAEVSMRRVRRIDVWAEDDTVQVDAMFQDSSTRPEGGRIAVHEYTLTATAERDHEGSWVLAEVVPIPRVLPYAECPLAVGNVEALLGTRLTDLRAVVLERLAGVAGCTHLNDALRALADVPDLMALNRAGRASPPTPAR